MCLEIELEMPANNRGDVENLARAIESKIPIEFALRHFSKKHHRARLTISEPRGGCACSLLSDNASWEDEHWRLRDEAFVWLSKALQSVFSNTSGEVSFSATWLGPDRHKVQEQRFTPEKFVAEVARGKISPRVRYVVSA